MNWDSTDWLILSHLEDRRQLGQLFSGPAVGVELGTHRGEFAAELLANWPQLSLYCVDPWIDHLSGYIDAQIHTNRYDDYWAASQRLHPYRDRVKILRTTSKRASQRFAPGSIDFLYVDANHIEPYVYEDMVVWSDKVREGGVYAGHDIINGDFLGVRRAIGRFCQERNIPRVFVIPGDAYSFYFPRSL